MSKPFNITPERLRVFRDKLRKEMLGPQQLWYYPTKPRNIDVYVYHPECPFANSTGKVPEHRYVWWLHHKDETIEYNELIHHINGDHQDNRPENLVKLKMKQHGIAHKRMKEEKLNKCG